MNGTPAPDEPITKGVWTLIASRVGSGAATPKLRQRVREVRFDRNVSLSDRETGRSFELTEDEQRWVQHFDGSTSVSELIVTDLATTSRFSMAPILDLIDRLGKADMLETAAANVYRLLDARFRGRSASTLGAARAADTDTGHGRNVGASSQLGVPAVKQQELEELALSEGADDATERSAAGLHAELADDISPDERLHTEAREFITSVDGKFTDFEQVPWRPRTPLLAERARFLRTLPILERLDDSAIGILAEVAHEAAFPATAVIVAQGDPSELFHIIKSGEAVVSRRDPVSGDTQRIAQLSPGDHFGEIGLLDNATRNATVKAGMLVPVVTYSFQPSVFARIIAPQIEGWTSRDRVRLGQRRQAIADLPLFSTFDDTEIARAADVLEELSAAPGEDIVTEGERGDRFYVITAGVVEVLRGEAEPIRLEPGAFFGETALLFDRPRSATVRAVEPTTLLSLAKADFEALIRGHLLADRSIMPTLLNRLAR